MSEWQPIESAPKDGAYIMVYPPTFNNVVSCASWDEDKYARFPRPFWRRTDSNKIYDSRSTPPTHWMPLPEPPK